MRCWAYAVLEKCGTYHALVYYRFKFKTSPNRKDLLRDVSMMFSLSNPLNIIVAKCRWMRRPFVKTDKICRVRNDLMKKSAVYSSVENESASVLSSFAGALEKRIWTLKGSMKKLRSIQTAHRQFCLNQIKDFSWHLENIIFRVN